MKIIKKEIVIEAPIPKVWEHITDPGKISGWLMPNDFQPSVGHSFYLKCDHQGKISCAVKEIVPHEKLVYSFNPPDLKIDTLVTITLAKAGRSTRLTLVHSGWDALPASQQSAADNYENGWTPLLERLKEQFAATASV